MNIYRVTGTSRETNAIGIMEKFVLIVHSENAKQAYDTVKSELYADNREHVHVMFIEREHNGDDWFLVETRHYL